MVAAWRVGAADARDVSRPGKPGIYGPPGRGPAPPRPTRPSPTPSGLPKDPQHQADASGQHQSCFRFVPTFTNPKRVVSTGGNAGRKCLFRP